MPIYESKLVNIFWRFHMKKLVFTLAILGLFTSSVYAKKVATCSSYLVGDLLMILVVLVNLF